MRISDWSSDVCSSDLPDLPPRPEPWCGDQARPCAWRNRAHRPALRPSGYERGRIPTDSLDDWPAQSQSHRNARRTRRLRRIEAGHGGTGLDRRKRTYPAHSYGMANDRQSSAESDLTIACSISRTQREQVRSEEQTTELQALMRI